MRKFRESLPMLLLRSRETTMAYFIPILKENNLTEQQWRVIRALYELKECNALELAKLSCILSPSLSRILTFLINEEIIIKAGSDIDNRAYVLKLSPKGVELHNKVGNPIEKKYKELHQKFGREKLETLSQLLHELSTLK